MWISRLFFVKRYFPYFLYVIIMSRQWHVSSCQGAQSFDEWRRVHQWTVCMRINHLPMSPSTQPVNYSTSLLRCTVYRRTHMACELYHFQEERNDRGTSAHMPCSGPLMTCSLYRNQTYGNTHDIPNIGGKGIRPMIIHSWRSG